MKTRVIGLSGGIGSGKTTVSELLRKLGASTIDADAIVHELQAPGTPVLASIEKAFGPQLIDSKGALDRAALGALVFRDEDARARLGAIVHPAVGAEMGRQLRLAVAAEAPVVVLDIPLLFESQREGSASSGLFRYDATVLVWVPAAMQIERTIRRDKCSHDEAQRRIRAQMPIDEKRELATHVIDNSGPLDETHEQTRRLYRGWLGATSR